MCRLWVLEAVSAWLSPSGAPCAPITLQIALKCFSLFSSDLFVFVGTWWGTCWLTCAKLCGFEASLQRVACLLSYVESLDSAKTKGHTLAAVKSKFIGMPLRGLSEKVGKRTPKKQNLKIILVYSTLTRLSFCFLRRQPKHSRLLTRRRAHKKEGLAPHNVAWNSKRISGRTSANFRREKADSKLSEGWDIWEWKTYLEQNWALLYLEVLKTPKAVAFGIKRGSFRGQALVAGEWLRPQQGSCALPSWNGQKWPGPSTLSLSRVDSIQTFLRWRANNLSFSGKQLENYSAFSLQNNLILIFPMLSSQFI